MPNTTYPAHISACIEAAIASSLLLIGAGFMVYPILLMQFRDRFSRYK